MDLFLVGCKNSEAARDRLFKLLAALQSCDKVDALHVTEEYTKVILKAISVALVLWHRLYADFHSMASEMFSHSSLRMGFYGTMSTPVRSARAAALRHKTHHHSTVSTGLHCQTPHAHGLGCVLQGSSCTITPRGLVPCACMQQPTPLHMVCLLAAPAAVQRHHFKVLMEGLVLLHILPHAHRWCALVLLHALVEVPGLAYVNTARGLADQLV
jgi:hypothetical protein